jgi:hypothetical protein
MGMSTSTPLIHDSSTSGFSMYFSLLQISTLISFLQGYWLFFCLFFWGPFVILAVQADVTEAFPKVYKLLEDKRIFLEHALLYESYALYLCAEGKVQEADKVYVTGISRLVRVENIVHSKFTSC